MCETVQLSSFTPARNPVLDATSRTSVKATKAKEHVESHAGYPLEACRNTVAPIHSPAIACHRDLRVL